MGDRCEKKVVGVLLLISQLFVRWAVCEITAEFCLNYNINLCNINCATSPGNCYSMASHHICPCILKCQEDHCMTGVMGQVCPLCSLHSDFCRPWHDLIELHSCGSKKMDSRHDFRNHCTSMTQCISQCPMPGECYDDTAKADFSNWDIYADIARVDEVLGT